MREETSWARAGSFCTSANQNFILPHVDAKPGLFEEFDHGICWTPSFLLFPCLARAARALQGSLSLD